MSAGHGGEVRLGRRAHGLKPAADVDLRVGFAAEMASAGCVGSCGVPDLHGERRWPALDEEPVDRIGGRETTDFTAIFLQRCHQSLLSDVTPLCREAVCRR